MRRQVELFFTALMFYTRVPCPRWVGHSEELLNKSTIYFPVMGWLVGGVAGLTLWGLQYFFPPNLALLLSMVASILMTGAFHEDGFADVCDGFGGGWTQERILDIMKDSRLGTYGAAGLGLILALKFYALQTINYRSLNILQSIIPVLIVAHALSRATALTFIYTHEYARANEDSKAKPVAKKLSLPELAVGLALGLLPLLAYAIWLRSPWLLLVLLPLWLVKAYLARYFQKWIGGYTGDCLGATQQVAEVVVYLFFSLRFFER
ncbi:adenosylcobinamide-GDP ribazoletransferase [Hymenobacter wooponensis]|uniref:Adenosylcobinamide-GDP ribazoletransferase n=2 Tax=Hymenobacter wooponensis TaxID=1525360 RepID=A0A4Z0MNL3_9BACT|nr:adenosylcobinamide-GDP ribazoletransferase [Hymenobacter wooponensis]TGD80876.1 adenosylcobinamide-GDP ribazoletransferase [Hymenobacter wooponensis]